MLNNLFFLWLPLVTYTCEHHALYESKSAVVSQITKTAQKEGKLTVGTIGAKSNYLKWKIRIRQLTNLSFAAMEING